MSPTDARLRPAPDLVVERVDLSRPAVLEEIVHLCGHALGWAAEDPNRDFFEWKHLANPFGVSHTWVARAGPELVGVRLLLRWQARRDGKIVELARAVDTATAPNHQGKGVFTALTTAAVRELTAEGVSAIFNTPNDKSRPGYLKMGWVALSRVPVGAAVLSPRACLNLARGGTTSKWGEPLQVGIEPAEAFSNAGALTALLASLPPTGALVSDRTTDSLRWRFGLPALGYRVWLMGTSLKEGAVVFRVRQRRGLRELNLVEVLLPGGRRLDTATWCRLARRCHADAVSTSAATRHLVSGLPHLPRRLGPVLTWRPLAEEQVPGPTELSFSHADLELF